MTQEELQEREKVLKTELFDVQNQLIKIAQERFFEKYAVRIGDEVEYRAYGREPKKGVLERLSGGTYPQPVVRLFKADRTASKITHQLYSSETETLKKIETTNTPAAGLKN